ncbi:hypothetical protein D3C81_1529460 [compost metagenome]
MLVAHFLLGHFQFLDAFPELDRHVHGGDDDQAAGHPKGAPANHLQAVDDRPVQRLMGDAQEVVNVCRQHQQGHEQHDEKLRQRLEQLGNGFGREHAFKPGTGVHAAELGGHGAGGEQPATEGNRADQRGQQQGDHHRLNRQQGDLPRVQQIGAHGTLVQHHLSRQRKVQAHQVHHFLGQRSAEYQQCSSPGKHDRQGVEFLGTGDLTLLTGVFFLFLRGVFCFVLTAFALSHDSARLCQFA